MNSYKTALVTGATGGIGQAIAKELVSQGMKVVITGRNEKKLNDLVMLLGEENVAYAATFDINDYSAMQDFVSKLKMNNIKIDALINNAGLALGLSAFQDYDINQVITMLDTNVKSLVLLSHLVLQEMKQSNTGIIINIGSTAGQYAYANASIYCATKAAVKTFSDGLRVDLMQTDIKVTTIMPGMVETDFSLVRFNGDKQKADSVYSGIAALQAQDVANAVWFVINQPKHCVISELALLANQQGNGFTNYKK